MKKFTLTMPSVWLMALLSLFFVTACSESDTGETGEETEDGDSTSYNTSSLYLVTQINAVNKSVTVNGDSSSYEEIWYFEYDEAGRVTSMYTNDSGDGTVSITYGDGEIVMVEENEWNQEETTFILGEDGYVTSFTSVVNYSYSQHTTTGTLTYSDDGYVMEGIRSGTERSGCIDTAVWEDGNLVEVSCSYTNNGVTEMRYDNPEYVNNTDISLDLNYLVCNTEWLDCMMFGGRYLQPYGYMGKRSALYMTEEYDRYWGYRYTYTYQFDELGRPVTIVCSCSGNSYYVSDECTYTIIYNK